MPDREGEKDQNRGWETCIGHSESFSRSVKPGRAIIGRTDVYGRCLQMHRGDEAESTEEKRRGGFDTPYDNRRWRGDESDGDGSSWRRGYARVCGGSWRRAMQLRLSSGYRSLLTIRGLFLQRWRIGRDPGTKGVRSKFASSRARRCGKFKWCYRPALGEMSP